tara:strand:- start:248 stop:664 length:417 start_codon:yes stop_codon:yes gene_type:complete
MKKYVFFSILLVKNLKAFVVCLAVTFLLVISAKAQQIDTVIIMFSGNEVLHFNTDNEVIDKKIHSENYEIQLDTNQILYLDLYDKKYRKNIFDKKMTRYLTYGIINGGNFTENLKSYKNGIKIPGTKVEYIIVTPIHR